MGLDEFDERAVRVHANGDVGHAVLAWLGRGYEGDVLGAQAGMVLLQFLCRKTEAN